MPNFASVDASGKFESPFVSDEIKRLAEEAVDTSSLASKSELSGKANATHSHSVSDVTGLQGALDGKQGAGSYATQASLESLQSTIEGLEGRIAALEALPAE